MARSWWRARECDHDARPTWIWLIATIREEIMLRSLFAVLMMAAVLVIPAIAQQDAHKIGEDIGKQWEVSFNRGDFAAVGSLYATDAVFSGAQGNVSGREAIAKFFGDRVKDGWTKVDVTVDQARDLGNN